MWVMYSRQAAIIINIILLLFLLLFIKNGREIYNDLAVSDNEAVTGKFSSFKHYEGLEELDKNDKVLAGGNIDKM